MLVYFKGTYAGRVVWDILFWFWSNSFLKVLFVLNHELSDRVLLSYSTENQMMSCQFSQGKEGEQT